MKKIISTNKAPAAIGPYSQAVWAGNLLFASGQIPIDPATGDIVAGDVQAQAHQCLKNVKAILESAKLDFERAASLRDQIATLKGLKKDSS